MAINTKSIYAGLLFIFSAQIAVSQSNLQTYTPSVLLQKGQIEYNLFNSLYSQTKIRDVIGHDVPLGERQSFLRNTFALLYGISENKKINIGFETNLVTARYTTPDKSIFSFFGKSQGDYKKTMLSSIGPKIKITPFENIGFLSIQSTLLFPVSNVEEGRFTDHDRTSWITQVFFDKSLSDKMRLFLEIGLLYRFKKLEAHNNFFRTPFSAIISYFPTSKSTIFGSFQHAPAFGKVFSETSSKFGQIRWFSTLGLGAKYQVTNSLGLELSYSNFFKSRNDGAGSTINLGVRIIK